MTEHRTSKGTETLEEAAARLLRRIEQRGKKVAGNQSPDQIAEIGRCPLADKGAGEAAAISACFTGQLPQQGTGRRNAKFQASNDNFAGGATGVPNRLYDTRPVSSCVGPARSSDDNATPKIARMVTLRGFGELDY